MLKQVLISLHSFACLFVFKGYGKGALEITGLGSGSKEGRTDCAMNTHLVGEVF